MVWANLQDLAVDRLLGALFAALAREPRELRVELQIARIRREGVAQRLRRLLEFAGLRVRPRERGARGVVVVRGDDHPLRDLDRLLAAVVLDIHLIE